MRAVAFALAFAFAFTPARAENRDAPKLEPAIDLPLVGAGALGIGLVEWNAKALVPGCRWCEHDASGRVDVNPFDRAVRDAFANRILAAPTWSRTSDVTIGLVLPLAALAVDWSVAHDRNFDRPFAEDAGLVLESVVASAAVDEAAKFLARRERPFAAFQAPYEAAYHASAGVADDDLSFFSGHSAVSMSMAVAASRLVELRTGSRLGYAILVPLAVATGLMRLAADKHWATDVLTGWAVGAVVGWVVPTLHAGG